MYNLSANNPLKEKQEKTQGHEPLHNSSMANFVKESALRNVVVKAFFGSDSFVFIKSMISVFSQYKTFLFALSVHVPASVLKSDKAYDCEERTQIPLRLSFTSAIFKKNPALTL